MSRHEIPCILISYFLASRFLLGSAYAVISIKFLNIEY